jgi:hypothetical protein
MTLLDCAYCIDGWTPETSEILGAAYRLCRACQDPCPCCHGGGWFMAELFDCDNGELVYDPTPLATAFGERGLMPLFCHTCMGMVLLLPTPNFGGAQ